MSNEYIFSRVFLENLIDCLAFISKIEVTVVVLIELCRQGTKKRKEEETRPKCKENGELKNMIQFLAETGRYHYGFRPKLKEQKTCCADMADTARYQPIPRPIPGVTARNQPIPRPLLLRRNRL